MSDFRTLFYKPTLQLFEDWKDQMIQLYNILSPTFMNYFTRIWLEEYPQGSWTFYACIAHNIRETTNNPAERHGLSLEHIAGNENLTHCNVCIICLKIDITLFMGAIF